MHRSVCRTQARFSVFSILGAALLLVPVMLAGIGTAAAGSPASPLSAAKLDPELYLAFQKLVPADRIIETERGDIEQMGDTIRVVVRLRPADGLTVAARGYSSLSAVQTAARAMQDRVLAQVRPEDFDVKTRLSLRPTLAGFVTESGLRRLQEMPEVESIAPDYIMYQHVAEGRALTHSDQAANALGYTGAGSTVAVTDGGFDYWNTWLGASIPYNDSCPGCFNPVVTYMRDVAVGDDDVYPGPGCTGTCAANCLYHGTGTSGIAHAYGPGNNLILIKVTADGATSTPSSVLAAGVECAIEHRDLKPTAPVRVISMSFGGGRYTSDCPSGAIQDSFTDAATAGIIPVTSSGNSGYDNALGSPGCSPNTIGVGSVFDVRNAAYAPFGPANCMDGDRYADERICYSNASPSLDIYAPSEEVVTATYSPTFAQSPHSSVAPLGGTSSACPAVAGAITQILQARPDLIGNRAGVLELMQATGAMVSNSPDPSYQNKRFDVVAAAQFSGAAPIVASFTATPSVIAPGGSSTLAWNCPNAAYVEISNGVAAAMRAGAQYTSVGSMNVTPTVTTFYTLTAVGPGGSATASASVTVSVTGAAMSVSPLSKNYGSVAVGSTATQTVTVTNTGTTELAMGALSFGGTNPSEFKLENDTASLATIPISGMRTVDVVFSPTSADPKSASLLVGSSGGTATVTLSGNGGGGGATDLSGVWGPVTRTGRGLNATLTVTNSGTDAVGSFKVKVCWSMNMTARKRTKLIKTETISGLAGGASKAIKIKASPRGSWLYIVGVLDADKSIPESDENNNVVPYQIPTL